MRRIVSLWFPDFAVERFIRGRIKQRRSPPPPGLPFALVEGGAKGLRLAAVNLAARRFGLGRGQRLADARAQVPDLLSEPHEAEEDLKSLLGLCRWMERYSPWVSPEPPDGILLDVSGVPHLFGGEAAMLQEMTRRLSAYGFTIRPGIAGTIGAAWALARYAGDRVEDLPVEALRIDGESARTLRRLGLKTIGALLNLPRAALARRFRGETIAENVLIRLDEMLGRRDEPLNPLNPPSSFMAHRMLMEPVISSEGLETILTGLVTALSRDLETKAQGATRLLLKLFRSDGSRISLPAGFSAATHDPRHMLRVLKPKLEGVDAGFGIDAMTLEARETGPAAVQQYGFTDDTGEAALEQLNDRVLNRHASGLVALEPVASHLPERAERPAPPAADARRKGPQPLSASGAGLPRPLLIFQRPEPAIVLASVPDGPPLRFTWRRVTRRVARAQGPERIAPEWWHLAEGAAPRDYYVIEDAQGRRYWLYREGLYGETGGSQPKWFVHGLSS
ncbi:MAG: DNA polymerase Y family protein [Alphaproteobacteria bacterium]|nr:DNA polymerase Y family protein [Alphaproteobacteria bacterium]